VREAQGVARQLRACVVGFVRAGRHVVGVYVQTEFAGLAHLVHVDLDLLRGGEGGAGQQQAGGEGE
jgi:hypothetical protein